MHDIKMFDRPGPLDTTGFDGSGADWVEQYKPLINDGQTVVCSPHKVYPTTTGRLDHPKRPIFIQTPTL